MSRNVNLVRQHDGMDLLNEWAATAAKDKQDRAKIKNGIAPPIENSSWQKTGAATTTAS
jgi:hypothetical protein